MASLSVSVGVSIEKYAAEAPVMKSVIAAAIESHAEERRVWRYARASRRARAATLPVPERGGSASE